MRRFRRRSRWQIWRPRFGLRFWWARFVHRWTAGVEA
jgi:hypothetical protein